MTCGQPLQCLQGIRWPLARRLHSKFITISVSKNFRLILESAQREGPSAPGSKTIPEGAPNCLEGEFHDQGDAKWIVIRGPLRGHNPMGGHLAGRPIGCQGFGHPQGVFGGLSYY
jgi:hypothetical protein